MNRHPEVRAKLNHLYSSGLQPTITGHAQLAQALGIARQNINRWISATSQQAGNANSQTQPQPLARARSHTVVGDN